MNEEIVEIREATVLESNARYPFQSIYNFGLFETTKVFHAQSYYFSLQILQEQNFNESSEQGILAGTKEETYGIHPFYTRIDNLRVVHAGESYVPNGKIEAGPPGLQGQYAYVSHRKIIAVSTDNVFQFKSLWHGIILEAAASNIFNFLEDCASTNLEIM